MVYSRYGSSIYGIDVYSEYIVVDFSIPTLINVISDIHSPLYSPSLIKIDSCINTPILAEDDKSIPRPKVYRR